MTDQIDESTSVQGKFRKDHFGRNLLIILNIALFAWCGFLTWRQVVNRPVDIVQLSVRTLFEEFIKEQKAADDPESLKVKSAAYSRELNAILKELSEHDDIVILVSEAVLSDHVVDITPEISDALKQRLEQSEQADE